MEEYSHYAKKKIKTEKKSALLSQPRMMKFLGIY